MNVSEKHASLWLATSSAPQFPRLGGDMVTDVAIVGGGITGLTTAALLKRAGMRVAVIEAARIGSGVTGHTTAHLTEAVDTRYKTLIENYGINGARLVAQSSRAAIERIGAFVAEEQIDCDFRRVPGYLYTESAQDVSIITQEIEAARTLGVAASMVTETPLPFPVQAAALFENQAQFHALKYLHGLARTIPGAGSHIFEMTRVLHISNTATVRLQTEHGTVTASTVILATHAPTHDFYFLQELLPLVQTRVFPYRSYVLGVRLRQSPLPQGLFWDTAEPYHYTRSYEDEHDPILIVGGADHKTGEDIDTEKPYRQLEAYVRFHFDVDSIPYRWSTQTYESSDGLPLIGKTPLAAAVYVATGYSGNGLTNGTIAAMIISDHILGRHNPWSALYDVGRVKPLTGVQEFIAENVDVARHFIGDRLSPDTTDLSDIAVNEGRIVRIRGELFAVYRDQNGTLHAFSPVCTHARCIVTWNTAEHTWDCPCHGGRFDAMGFVLNSPPVTDLEPKQLP